jgi:hypothetical protein
VPRPEDRHRSIGSFPLTATRRTRHPGADHLKHRNGAVRGNRSDKTGGAENAPAARATRGRQATGCVRRTRCPGSPLLRDRVAIREAVHLLILRRLASLADGGAVTLKGGFFGVRCRRRSSPDTSAREQRSRSPATTGPRPCARSSRHWRTGPPSKPAVGARLGANAEGTKTISTGSSASGLLQA